MYYIYVILFGIFLGVSWGLNLMGLPGNWIMVAICAAFTYFFHGIGWRTVGILAAIALFGEAIEFLAGMAGVTKGGSKRGAVLAIAGSCVGGIIGAFIGLPIPFVGSLIAALLFASAGALVGAAMGEMWKGSGWRKSVEVGRAAFWGRLFGTLAKIVVGSVILGVALASALLGHQTLTMS